MKKLSPELKQLMKTAGSTNYTKAIAAQQEIVKALELPLQEGVFDGDIVSDTGIFEMIQIEPGQTREYPLHFLSPGTEKEHVAYTIPNAGYIPHMSVEGDYVMLPSYDIGNSKDVNLKYIRNARWDVMTALTEAYQAGFTKKINDDSWHVILAAGVDRNIVVRDADKSAAGQFTKRVVSLGKTVMRRNGGGNSNSLNRGKLTDIYLSPESMEDIRNWNVDQIDEITRREIFIADGDSAITRIFGVNLHDLDELGEGQEYQLYLENELSVTLPGSDVEVAIGLDLQRGSSFISMIGPEGIETSEDPTLHRQRKFGIYGWLQDFGVACVDNRSAILLSI